MKNYTRLLTALTICLIMFTCLLIKENFSLTSRVVTLEIEAIHHSAQIENRRKEVQSINNDIKLLRSQILKISDQDELLIDLNIEMQNYNDEVAKLWRCVEKLNRRVR